MPVAYIQVVKDMYTRIRTRVITLLGDIDDFLIDIGLYQGLVLSLILFTVVMDELTREI